MAYAALVSLSQTLDQLTNGDENQIKSLQEKLCFLQAFLEEHGSSNSGERVDPMEERIREAAYRAEDAIEIRISSYVRACSYVSKYGRMQDQDKRRYEDLQQRYDKNLQREIEEMYSLVEIAKERKRSRGMEDPAPNHSLDDGLSRGLAVSCVNTAVTGLDKDLIELKARLCGEPDQLRTISIVGMAGIGKTTLARSIFDDSLAAEHFDFRAWVTVSQEHFLRGILLGLLTSLNAINTDLSKKDNGTLAVHAYQNLKGRRYLIVMDDIWSTQAWDDLKRILPDDSNGSRIIITTRLSEVAIYADSSSPLHHIQLLDNDQSWSLLQKKVFEKEPWPSELEKTGKMIAGKCRGLPLLIVLVAGLLSKIVKTVNQWDSFAANVSSTLATSDANFFKIISLSYNDLPHHLRACFLYMGGFPEDYEIPVSRLTQLWVAEGFLKPFRSQSLEEVAEECVGDLVKRNLISITKKSSTGRFRFCSIHDILRDFCIRKAQNENFLHVNRSSSTSQEGLQGKRRVCIPMRDSIPSNESGSLLRSIQFFNKKNFTVISIPFSLLRVFNGTNAGVDLFNLAAAELVRLRYLSFSYACVHLRIPALISKLINLQTLVIQPQYGYFHPLTERSRDEIHLPLEIWNMPKLRHLILHNYCFLPHPSVDKSGGNTRVALHNLQTLSRLANFSFTSEIAQMIPNLKKLGAVYYNERLIDPYRYYLYNLRCFHQLESLSLCFAFSSISEHSLRSHFAQNFALPQSLKKITLTGSGLSWQKLSVVGRLPYLEVLKLRQESVVGQEWTLKASFSG